MARFPRVTVTTNHITGDNPKVDNSQTGGPFIEPIEPGDTSNAIVTTINTGHGNVINDSDGGDLIS